MLPEAIEAYHDTDKRHGSALLDYGHDENKSVKGKSERGTATAVAVACSALLLFGNRVLRPARAHRPLL